MRTAESATLDVSFAPDILHAALREHPIRLAVLFVSHATETTLATSDIDLAVEFDTHRPADSDYNDIFLEMSADLSVALETDDVELADMHTIALPLAAAIIENGVLLIGTGEHAAELHRQLTASGDDQQSPRDRLDAPWAESTTISATAILGSQPRARPRTTDGGPDTAGGSSQPDSDRCRNHRGESRCPHPQATSQSGGLRGGVGYP